MVIQKVPIESIEIGGTYLLRGKEFPVEVTDLGGGVVYGLLKQPGRLTPVTVACELLSGRDSDIIPIVCIVKAVAAEFEVSEEELRGSRRARHIAWPRQVVMYLGHVLAGHSLPKVGRHLGQRDHTTVLYGARKTIERAIADPDYADRIQRVWEAVIERWNCRASSGTRGKDEQPPAAGEARSEKTQAVLENLRRRNEPLKNEVC